MTQFEKDVVEGLNQEPKRLYSKYFYDEIGDDLFVQIMHMPEYYLTRAEMEIFSEKTDELIDSISFKKEEHFKLIELGAGDGTKTKKLLKAYLDKGYDFEYLPIDISINALRGLEKSLEEELPNLDVEIQQGEYFEVLDNLKKQSAKKLILFLGSNIGNLTDDQSQDFILQLSSSMRQGDVLLLGVDLIKPKEIVLPAYDDAAGITKAFNLNILTRMNRELGANFDLSKWQHYPTYDEDEGIMRSYLRSTAKQSIYFQKMKKGFTFAAGEKVLVEISRKYNDAILNNILKQSGLSITEKTLDSKGYFADYILLKE